MGDHFDFRGGVFNEPFIGKQVTQVTTVQQVEVARIDDKVYVVRRYDWVEGDWESDTEQNIAAAMSLEGANQFILGWKDPEGYLEQYYENHTDDRGRLQRYFRSEDGERMHLSVDVLTLV